LAHGTWLSDLALLDLDSPSPLNGANYTRVIQSTQWITSMDNYRRF